MQQLQGVGPAHTPAPARACAAASPSACKRILHSSIYQSQQHVPDKVVELLHGNAQFELLEVLGDFAHQACCTGSQSTCPPAASLAGRAGPARPRSGSSARNGWRSTACWQSCALASTLFGREAHVVARAVSGGQGKAQRVGAVLVDDLQRVDAVAQRFGHLAPLGIPDQAVDEHRT